LLPPLAVEVLCLLPILPIAANILVFTTQTKSDGAFVGVILLASTVLSCVLFAVLQLVRRV
jgi:predicted permease